MLRAAFFFVLASALPSVQAYAYQVGGAPASVLSPTSPGVAHGTPSSVISTPSSGRVFFSPGPRVTFGPSRRHNHRRPTAFVPIPIFIPTYPLTGDSYSQDQAPADVSAETDQAAAEAANDAPSADSDALRQAYYRGAHDALAAAQPPGDSRYGDHYFDSREKTKSTPAGGEKSAVDSQKQDSSDDPGTQNQADNDSPAAIFVFKDGHRIETRNYAIQGQTLFDFSNNRLTRVKLAELDLDATRKANDDLGITVRLPGAP